VRSHVQDLRKASRQIDMQVQACVDMLRANRPSMFASSAETPGQATITGAVDSVDGRLGRLERSVDSLQGKMDSLLSLVQARS
jgi:hypothetical protein